MFDGTNEINYIVSHIPITSTDMVSRELAIINACGDLNLKDSTGVLYVGGSVERHDFMEWWKDKDLDVVEIDKSKADGLKASKTSLGISEVINEDIRSFKPSKRYKLAVWWHGPEHVSQKEAEDTIKEIEKYSDMVLLGTPWGYSPGDPQHTWQVLPEWLDSMRYTTVTVGEKDRHDKDNGGSLVGFKVIKGV